MGFVEQWIMQITAVIIIGSVCDLLMPDGNIKKYINPVLGFMLIFVIVKPITALDADKIRMDLLTQSSISGEITSITDDVARENILELYQQKLSDKVTQEIQNTYGIASEIALSARDGDADFGEISGIDVVLFMNEGDFINTQTVSKMIENKFGIDLKSISIETEVIN